MVNREDCGGNGETYLKYLGAEALVAGLAPVFLCISVFKTFYLFIFIFFNFVCGCMDISVMSRL